MKAQVVNVSTGQVIRETSDGLADPAGQRKDQAEVRLQEALERFWRGQIGRVEARLDKKVPKARKADELGLDREFWANEEAELLAVLLPLIAEEAEAASELLSLEIEARYGLGLDWTMANAAAVEWARQHAGQLVRGLNGASRQYLARLIAQWLETPGATMGDLYKKIEAMYAFDPRRARLVAVTEVTQAYAQGNLATAQAAEDEYGEMFVVVKTWHTNNDELVCPMCGPMNGATAEGADGDEWSGVGFAVPAPPLHPGCRCWITYQFVLRNA